MRDEGAQDSLPDAAVWLVSPRLNAKVTQGLSKERTPAIGYDDASFSLSHLRLVHIYNKQNTRGTVLRFPKYISCS